MRRVPSPASRAGANWQNAAPGSPVSRAGHLRHRGTRTTSSWAAGTGLICWHRGHHGVALARRADATSSAPAARASAIWCAAGSAALWHGRSRLRPSSRRPPEQVTTRAAATAVLRHGADLPVWLGRRRRGGRCGLRTPSGSRAWNTCTTTSAPPATDGDHHHGRRCGHQHRRRGSAHGGRRPRRAELQVRRRLAGRGLGRRRGLCMGAVDGVCGPRGGVRRPGPGPASAWVRMPRLPAGRTILQRVLRQRRHSRHQWTRRPRRLPGRRQLAAGAAGWRPGDRFRRAGDIRGQNGGAGTSTSAFVTTSQSGTLGEEFRTARLACAGTPRLPGDAHADASLRGTGGLALDRDQLQVSALSTSNTLIGLAAQHHHPSISSGGSAPSWRFGWVVGVGAEQRIGTTNWIGRLEYLHYDFGTFESATSSSIDRRRPPPSTPASSRGQRPCDRRRGARRRGATGSAITAARTRGQRRPAGPDQLERLLPSASMAAAASAAGDPFDVVRAPEPLHARPPCLGLGRRRPGQRRQLAERPAGSPKAWKSMPPPPASMARPRPPWSSSRRRSESETINEQVQSARLRPLCARLGWLPWPNLLVYGTGGARLGPGHAGGRVSKLGWRHGLQLRIVRAVLAMGLGGRDPGAETPDRPRQLARPARISALRLRHLSPARPRSRPAPPLSPMRAA